MTQLHTASVRSGNESSNISARSEFDYQQLLEALWKRADYIFSSMDLSRAEKFELTENALLGAAFAVNALLEGLLRGDRTMPNMVKRTLDSAPKGKVSELSFVRKPFPDDHNMLLTDLWRQADDIFARSGDILEQLTKLQLLLQSTAQTMHDIAHRVETDADFEWSL